MSGRCAAEAILAGDPAGYAARLARHEVIADYRRVHRVVAAAGRLPRRAAPRPSRPASLSSRAGGYAVARAFGWMFSGARLPVPRLLDRVLALLPDGR